MTGDTRYVIPPGVTVVYIHGVLTNVKFKKNISKRSIHDHGAKKPSFDQKTIQIFLRNNLTINYVIRPLGTILKGEI